MLADMRIFLKKKMFTDNFFKYQIFSLYLTDYCGITSHTESKILLI